MDELEYRQYDFLTSDLREHIGHKNALIEAIEKNGDSALLDRARKMQTCATYALYGVDEHGETGLVSSNFCRQRVCPVCQWRRSLRAYAVLFAAAEALSDEYSYIMLTVSRPNCIADMLPDEITALYHSCDRLMKRKQIRLCVHGGYRALEVTYNAERGDYHPHLHIVLAVRPSYFNSRYYIPRADWVALWNEVNSWDRDKVGYDLELDVRRMGADLGGGIAEVAKYCIKPVSPYSKNWHGWEEAVIITKMIDRVLSGRRLFRSWGCIRDAIKSVSLSDNPDVTLEDIALSDGGDYKEYISLWWNGDKFDVSN